MNEPEVTIEISGERKQMAVQTAKDRAKAAQWSLDVAVFLFAVLIIIIILLFQEVEIIIVSPVAVFGLAMVWLVGWRRGKQLYERFYHEEVAKLEEAELIKTARESVEETIEERVQKALRERLR